VKFIQENKEHIRLTVIAVVVSAFVMFLSSVGWSILVTPMIDARARTLVDRAMENHLNAGVHRGAITDDRFNELFDLRMIPVMLKLEQLEGKKDGK